MPGRFELKPTLAKIWHAPDNFRIMEPLPPMHRRGIIIAAIVLVIGFLLPAMEKSQLFRGVIADGVLPRKTFSMGHSREKRYYLEGRKIKA